MSMIIRDLEKTDAKAYIQLRKKILKESVFMLREDGEYNPSVEEVRDEIDRINVSKNSCILIAESEKRLIGFSAAHGSSLRRIRHSTRLFMAVLKSHWGQGVARKLLQSIVHWAKYSQLKRITLSVDTQNTRAINLYKRMGFKIEGTSPAAIRLDGIYRDEHIMGLLIDR